MVQFIYGIDVDSIALFLNRLFFALPEKEGEEERERERGREREAVRKSESFLNVFKARSNSKKGDISLTSKNWTNQKIQIPSLTL